MSNPFKQLSAEEIEQIISEALSTKLGRKITAKLGEMAFTHPFGEGGGVTVGKLELTSSMYFGDDEKGVPF